MRTLIDGRGITAAWRIIVLVLLGILTGELVAVNRHLGAIQQAVPDSTDLTEATSGLEEKLDKVNSNLEDLWQLTNERVK